MKLLTPTSLPIWHRKFQEINLEINQNVTENILVEKQCNIGKPNFCKCKITFFNLKKSYTIFLFYTILQDIIENKTFCVISLKLLMFIPSYSIALKCR